LLIVNVSGAVVVPTAAVGKSNSATFDCRMIGGDPVPVRLTVVVTGIALLPVTVSVALSVPTTDGENVTWILQLAPGANDPVHAAISPGGLSAKSPACAPFGPVIPPTANVGSVIVTCPMFVTCTVYALLENPTTTVPRLTEVGETPSIGGESPVPLRVVDCAATPVVVVPTVSVAVIPPTESGVKMTCKVQDPPAATLAPQVLVPTAKLVDPAPEIEKLGCPSGAPPVLEIVNVFAAVAVLISSLPNSIVAGFKLILGGATPRPLRWTD
jgi:hypothetical protein